MEDIEIARNTKLYNISEIAKKINISEDDLELYGKYKAKISNSIYSKIEKNDVGKLILVTAINPTPLGEGKTTVSIGLADGLNKINKKAILALREPSLGPVFGIKGGATGGGYSQVAPMDDINLHFTGDIHAITAANNLLAAMIDNHIFAGNTLNIKKVVWKRCMDMNDRALRKIEIGLSGEKGMVSREDGFDISVASEIMAILCLSNDLEELKKKLSKIIIGYNKNNKPIFVKDINAQGAMAALLKDAINPNLVQTLEHNPAIIHGGPFANIAHGCNSVRATKLALKLGEYVVTEAGFGADLGAEKFIDIKCRENNLKPDCVVCVATLKSLKYHGGASEFELPNIDSLKIGIKNLLHHVDNLKNKFNCNVVVAINKFNNDTEEEINLLIEELNKMDVKLSLTENWGKGGIGAVDLANKVVELSENNKELKFAYELKDDIKDKIFKVATKIYGAKDVEYSDEALEQLEQIKDLKIGDEYPICIAKTQYSFSDNAKNLLCEDDFNIHVNNIEIKNGAEFIVVKTGKIMTMPGLPKVPAAEKIDIDNNGNIYGIF